jgi:hypothetical protein
MLAHSKEFHSLLLYEKIATEKKGEIIFFMAHIKQICARKRIFYERDGDERKKMSIARMVRGKNNLLYRR